MTSSLHKKKGRNSSPKTVALREEFVALTQDPLIAIVLNQLVYWTQRVKDFDLFLEEERFYNSDCNLMPRHGWIYKTANDLIEETMICVDRTTMRRYLKVLMEKGWLEERSNPHNKWNKTTQYRLNLRNLRDDLFPLGFELPGINVRIHREYINEREHEETTSDVAEMAESSNVQNASSKGSLSEEQISPSNVRTQENSHSKGYTSPSEEQIAPSERLNSPFLSTENTHKNKNREHTEKARAQENFSDPDESGADESDPDKSGADESDPDKSVAKEMLSLWESHIVQKLAPTNWRGTLHLTEERKNQLESLFRFYFQNDICLWERFCLRIKGSDFLMGGGAHGWTVTLDWILDESKLLKVLEGNYDDSKRTETMRSCDWKLPPIQPNPGYDAGKAAILATIKDPVWKSWCSQLAEGVRLNALKMLHEPLSVSDLRQIANARFLECEDERLVWVGSSDQRTLNKIEDLRLKISWIFVKDYPKTRTFRTRLMSAYTPQITGENHAE